VSSNALQRQISVPGHIGPMAIGLPHVKDRPSPVYASVNICMRVAPRSIV
jgi:hypothetical protein